MLRRWRDSDDDSDDRPFFTMKEAEEELGFVAVEIESFRLRQSACDLEAYLQNELFLMHCEEVDGVVHRRLGIQLHRAIGMGMAHAGVNEQAPEYCCTVFAAIAPITNAHWDESHDHPLRRWMELNGTPVRICP